jgi:AraC-like DNA-binding protein
MGSLRPGRSCGCQEDPHIRQKTKRSRKLTAEFENYLLYGDMLFDITNVLSLDTFADRLDNYTFLLYKAVHINICLTRKYIDSTLSDASSPCELDFHTGDDMKVILSKSAVKRNDVPDGFYSSADIIPEYFSDRDYPVAYYISPLHYNNNFFGYTALSFGKVPFSFSTIFIQWTNYVNVALEHIRVKLMMNNTISAATRALMYESITGMLGRMGIEKEFARINVPELYGRRFDFITVEITGIKTTYYRSGEEKCRNIIRDFAGTISGCAPPPDICGMWNDNTFCIITDQPDRAGDIYRQLSADVRSFPPESSNSSGRDFTVGVFSFTAGTELSAAEIMHRSTLNMVFSLSSAELAANPQFEKLFMLRSRIMKNPELPWNIGEIAESLFLSKSYLQKIYKSYFNKSIIEEMIEFRIAKATELLSSTDLTITEIARKCGYSSYNYFVRQFRLSKGASPSEYRDAVRKAAENES